jgi:hypothetical protein
MVALLTQSADLLYTRRCRLCFAQSADLRTVQDGAPEAAGTRGCARNTRGSKQVTTSQIKILKFFRISLVGFQFWVHIQKELISDLKRFL